MKHQVLISADRFIKPLYLMLNALKWRPRREKNTSHFIVLKFFGLGSITRIAHVMEVANISKHRVTFVTLDTNKAILTHLNINAFYIKTNHLFSLIGSVFSCIVKIWRLKNVRVLDMERASNFSGIFRLITAIGKPCTSFSFASENNHKAGQFFISLFEKSATDAIAEMFDATYKITKKSANKQPDSEKILVNINASNYLPQRKFHFSKYADLIQTLHERKPDAMFHLTGIESEVAYVEQFKTRLIAQKVPAKQIIIKAGKQSLVSFVNDLKSATLFITNDSGPMHLARINNVPTAILWGPTSAKLVGYENSANILNLEPKEDCYPCFIHPKSKVAEACSGELTCFQKRNINETADQICHFIQAPNQ